MADAQVLTVTPAGIARIVAFVDPSVFAAFGLGPSLDSLDADGLTGR
ncbi:hypothetical protein [Kitasatospora sp. MAP5-34]|nr:hypothetical protein [Kitasatospora sp. MAP5-34]MDH6576464.1 hypothetical protein [Kitasatospora sp. MAP5-34]